MTSELTSSQRQWEEDESCAGRQTDVLTPVSPAKSTGHSSSHCIEETSTASTGQTRGPSKREDSRDGELPCQGPDTSEVDGEDEPDPCRQHGDDPGQERIQPGPRQSLYLRVRPEYLQDVVRTLELCSANKCRSELNMKYFQQDHFQTVMFWFLDDESR